MQSTKIQTALMTIILTCLVNMPSYANTLENSSQNKIFQGGEKCIFVLIATLGIMWILFLVSLECTKHVLSDYFNVLSAFFLPVSEVVFVTAGMCQISYEYIKMAWLMPIIILLFNISCILIAAQKNRIRQIASLISLSVSSVCMVELFIVACLIPYFIQTLAQIVGF